MADEPDDTAPGGKPGGGKGFMASLKKPVAGMPLGVWLVIVGVGLGIAYYKYNKSKQAAANSAYVSSNAGVPGVGSSSFGAYTQLTPVLPTQPAIVTNEDWQRAAVQFLISEGMDPGMSDTAIRHYLAAVVLTPTDQALVNQVLAKAGIGLPPVPVPETGQNSVVPTIQGFFLQEGGGSAVWAALSDNTRKWITAEEWQQMRESSTAGRFPFPQTLSATNEFWNEPVIGVNPGSGFPEPGPFGGTINASQHQPIVPTPISVGSPSQGREYTTKPFDTLFAIAQAYYGNGYRWPDIVNANKGVVSNPDNVVPGTHLIIP